MKEFDLDAHCKKLAKEVGTDYLKLFKVIEREFEEIRFKGIEFTKLDISFQIAINSMSKPSMIVNIWCSALDVSDKWTTEPSDSRQFVMPYRQDEMQSVFWLIYFWKKDLIENHSKLLKVIPQKTLFEQQ